MARSKRDRLYMVWWNMRRRCYDPSSDRYSTYGGRGIRVCRRWAWFENFYNDLQHLWSEGLWLERRDADGHYTPQNCHFTTQLRQANNKTNTKWLDVFGERLSLADAVRKYGVVSYDTVKRRINVEGWSPEKSLTTPCVPHKDRSWTDYRVY